MRAGLSWSSLGSDSFGTGEGCLVEMGPVVLNGHNWHKSADRAEYYCHGCKLVNNIIDVEVSRDEAYFCIFFAMK